jgi:hypothetical protein
MDTSRLTFPRAVAAVICGECITRLEWDDPDCYGMLRSGMLQLYRDGEWHNWLVSEGDMLGTDWVTLDHRHPSTAG